MAKRNTHTATGLLLESSALPPQVPPGTPTPPVPPWRADSHLAHCHLHGAYWCICLEKQVVTNP